LQISTGASWKFETGEVKPLIYRPLISRSETSEVLRRQAIATKQSIVSLFLSRFTLNDEEVEAMVSRDVPVGQRFFDAMDKTERIRQDCQVLMAGEEGPTQVGSVSLLYFIIPS
jgi:Conserved oligomeric complex COG6